MSTLAEWTSRWDAFQDKLTRRLDEVHEEAMGAFDGIAESSPLDHTPHAALDMAIQGRHNKIGDKLDTAVETLEEGLDSLSDDASDAEEAKIQALLDKAQAAQSELQFAIELNDERCKVDGAARIAEAIEAAFRAEDPQQSCAQCGNPFDPGPITQSTAVTCPGCGANVTVGPHPAAMAWYSRGVDAVARKAAWSLFVAHRKAEAHYNDDMTPDRLESNIQAAEAYHRAVFGTLVERHPAWDEAKAEEQIQGRCNQIRSMHDRFQ